MRATNDAQFKSVLTPEQFEKWQTRHLDLEKALESKTFRPQ
jgi:Spy/CpxP family protein refolding chaperone